MVLLCHFASIAQNHAQSILPLASQDQEPFTLWGAAKMKNILIALAALVVYATSSAAQVDEGLCTIEPSDDLFGMVFTPTNQAPAPASVNTITIRNAENDPVANYPVWVELRQASTVLCGSTVLSGVTNASGQLVLTLGGGGCAHNTALSALVKAGGQTIRTYANVKSPDYDGAGGNLAVTLPDLTQFSGEFGGSIPSACHDYNNDGSTGLPDLIIFGAPFQSAASCAP
jgi:hypothetical protein